MKKLMTWLSVALFVTARVTDASFSSLSVQESLVRSFSPLSAEESSVASSISRSSSFGDEKHLYTTISDTQLSNEHIKTVLLKACLDDDCRAVNYLIKKKDADVNAKYLYGSTILHDVVYDGTVRIAELLLKKGACVNATNFRSATPLHQAVNSYSPEMACLLLNYGADIDAVDCDGDTALHYAFNHGARFFNVKDKEVISELLAAGANAYAKNQEGHSPLDYANRSNDPNIIAMFRPRIQNSCNVS